MRRRTIFLTLFIVAVLAVSVTALALPEIRIGIPGLGRLERAETGPLGLKLGLDLQGGAHLVYQAQTGTTLSIAYPDAAAPDDTGPNDAAPNDAEPDNAAPNDAEPSDAEPDDAGVDAEALRAALADAGYDGEVTQDGAPPIFTVTGAYLPPDRRDAVRQALTDALGEPLTFAHSDQPPPTSDQMDGVLNIISRRVNLYGTEEPIVQRFGADRIIVQLPGRGGTVLTVFFDDDADVAPETVQTVAVHPDFAGYEITLPSDRQLRIAAPETLDNAQRDALLATLTDEIGGVSSFQTSSGSEDAKRLIGETAQLEFLRRQCGGPVAGAGCLPPISDTDIGLTGDDLDEAYASTDQATGEWVVNIEFNDRGAGIFSQMTGEINVRTNPDSTEVIAVVLDGQPLIAPVSLAHIRDGRSQISGSFDREEARTLAIQLKSGRLPVPLELIQESEVDSLLGAESLERSLMAGLVGLGLVLIFVIAYYRAAGVVAAVALLCYAVVTLAIFKLVPITLTLPHIGGFILSIGLAVDANILIFERIKEEIRLGRSLASAMEVGFNRAWPAIRDGNVSTLITCVVLLWFGSRLGGGLVNGFALTLLVGVLVSMFTAVLVSRNLLQALHALGLGRMAALFTPEKIPPRRAAGQR